MNSYKKRKYYRYRLKKMANKIESVITEKEIESLKKEIQVLEQEIMKCDFLTDNNKKKYCNIILKIHTKEELYKIQKEIDDIRSEVENQKKTLSKRESNLLEKEDKIDYWSSEKVLVEKQKNNAYTYALFPKLKFQPHHKVRLF